MEPTIRKRAENLKPQDLFKLTRADGIRWFEIVRTKFSNPEETMVTIEMVDSPCAPEDRVPPWTVETSWDARFDVISPDGCPDDAPEMLPYPPEEVSTVILPPAPIDVPDVPEEAPAEVPSASDGLEDSVRAICANFSEQLLAIVKKHR